MIVFISVNPTMDSSSGNDSNLLSVFYVRWHWPSVFGEQARGSTDFERRRFVSRAVLMNRGSATSVQVMPLRPETVYALLVTTAFP